MKICDLRDCYFVLYCSRVKYCVHICVAVSTHSDCLPTAAHSPVPTNTPMGVSTNALLCPLKKGSYLQKRKIQKRNYVNLNLVLGFSCRYIVFVFFLPLFCSSIHSCPHPLPCPPPSAPAETDISIATHPRTPFWCPLTHSRLHLLPCQPP